MEFNEHKCILGQFSAQVVQHCYFGTFNVHFDQEPEIATRRNERIELQCHDGRGTCAIGECLKNGAIVFEELDSHVRIHRALELHRVDSVERKVVAKK